MRKEESMVGKTDIMFGHKGSASNPLVNLTRMAEQTGASPATIKQWNQGDFPKSLTTFARICKFRGLKPDQIVDLVKAFE